MRADEAARKIRQDLKAMGISADVTTVKRLYVNIAITDVAPGWLWEYVDGAWKKTEQAMELQEKVHAVWNTPAYRLQCEIEGLPVYDYNGSVGFDYKIRTPELQTV